MKTKDTLGWLACAILAAAIFLLTAELQGQSAPDNEKLAAQAIEIAVAILKAQTSPSNIVALLQASGQLTNVITELRNTGEICKSVGRHSFRDGRPGEGEGGGGAWYADMAPMYTDFRTCRVCGRQETRSREWSGPPDPIQAVQHQFFTNRFYPIAITNIGPYVLTNFNVNPVHITP